MAIDSIRHQSVFSPEAFGDRRVDVIGVGATGSAVAMGLLKLGVRNLHVWDDDVVEDHNIANQVYGLQHIGQSKVAAMQDLATQFCDAQLTLHAERVTSKTRIPAEFVFLLVDSMAARADIASGLRYNARTRACFETRMGTRHGHLFTFDPSRPSQYAAWVRSLWTDAEVVDPSACGARTSVGATANLLASFALLAFVDASHERLSQATEMFVSTAPVCVSMTELSDIQATPDAALAE